MSYANLLQQYRSGHVNRRTLVGGLVLLAVPGAGASLLAETALAGRKTRKAAKRNRKTGRGASAQGCGGSCK